MPCVNVSLNRHYGTKTSCSDPVVTMGRDALIVRKQPTRLKPTTSVLVERFVFHFFSEEPQYKKQYYSLYIHVYMCNYSLLYFDNNLHYAILFTILCSCFASVRSFVSNVPMVPGLCSSTLTILIVLYCTLLLQV